MYPFLNVEMIMTGPNDSSLAMYMWSCTSVKIVGSKKNPKSSQTIQINKLYIVYRHGVISIYLIIRYQLTLCN